MSKKVTNNVSPLRYPGGKNQIYNFVRKLVLLNGTKTYIEPYMGGAGVALRLLVNGDVKKIMVNDYDKAIYAFWYSVLNYTKDLVRLIEEAQITPEEWYNQKQIYNAKDTTEDILALGFATLFLNRTNRSGILKAGMIGGKSQLGNYKMDCRFNKNEIIRRIQLIAKFKSCIHLYNLDAEVFIKNNISKTKDSLTFFDPPYFQKGPGLYTNFYNYDNHLSLSDTIKKHMGQKKWILTYDVSDEIMKMYEGFDFQKYYLNYSAAKPEKGIEYIFYSKLIKQLEDSDLLKVID